MDRKSLNVKDELIKQLRKLMPETFTEDKIDWEKLKVVLGENINFSNERYVLNWAGKSEAFRAFQMPTAKTLIPAKEESINFDKTENIFIEGENLEVLKVLQKSYFGKIKMIYIDPPYNTGNDFIYKDNFAENKADYQKRVGDKDENGNILRSSLFKNTKENGHYHSNWLNMMYPRLFLARNLLRQDGVIFVSIDDNEVHNLRMVMNEILGEENFVAQFVWRKTDNQANIGNIARVKEYILCYAKSDAVKMNKMKLTERARKEYRYKDEVGRFRRGILLDKTRGRHFYEVKTYSGKTLNGPWMIDEDKFKSLEKESRIYWTKGGNEQPYGKIYLKDSVGQISNDFLGIDFGTNQQGSLEVEKLFKKRIFDFPKPFSLVKHFITIGTNDNDIILDFFAGSATAAHAVLSLNQKDGSNRKFICVQMPKLCAASSEAYKSGYKNIADIAKERIRRVISEIQKEQEEQQKKSDKSKMLEGKTVAEKNQPALGFKVLKLAKSNFKQWRQEEILSTGGAIEKQMELFINPVLEDAEMENIIYELLLKSGKNLNSEIIKQDNCYLINGNELVLLLEEVNQSIINKIIKLKPQKVITLDNLFFANDQLKTNMALQMKDVGIEFKTI